VYVTLGLLQALGAGIGFIALVVIALFVISLIFSAIKIVNEYERGVIFRLGRVQGGPKGPGLFILVPFVDKMVKIDLRTVTMDVPPQDVITRDNVPARVNAVIYFRVVDPNKSVIEVENHVVATSQISQTTLRSVLGQRDLDDLLTNREEINSELQRIIDDQTIPGASRSAWWRSRTWRSRSRCSGRWLGRPRASASAAPRSSPPRASTRPPSASGRRPTGSRARRRCS
jgi:hypothetical protein